jgi:hypothetical protein
MGLKTRVFNIDELVELTGKNPKTIKKRLHGLEPAKLEGRGIYYDAQDALPLIFLETRIQDPKERTKNDEEVRAIRLKNELAQVKLDTALGDSLPVQMIESAWGQLLSTFRARVLGIPSKLSPVLEGLNKADIKKTLDKETRDICEELSNFDTTQITASLADEMLDADQASTEADGQ